MSNRTHLLQSSNLNSQTLPPFPPSAIPLRLETIKLPDNAKARALVLEVLEHAVAVGTASWSYQVVTDEVTVIICNPGRAAP
jgi:hypothetical protein